MSDFNSYDEFIKEYSKSKKPIETQHSKPPKRPKKNNKLLIKRLIQTGLALVLIALLVGLLAFGISMCDSGNDGTYNNLSNSSAIDTNAEPKPAQTLAVSVDYTVNLGSEISSTSAILVDRSDNTVLAEKSPDKVVYPASLTKVMTLLVAAENIDNIDATYLITSKLIDPLYLSGASMAGFEPGETARIEDMFYGMILESGAEASVGLAEYISGSESAFVELMNKKAQDLGLKNTHFTNVTGLHNKDHYTTCREMAAIVDTTLKNDFCKKVLSTKYYTVPANEHHEQLEFYSTILSRMTGKEPDVATVLGGKTGYTANSGNCLLSFGITDDGREIISVTTDGGGTYKPIDDCVYLYKNLTHPRKK
jgi:D-alanyl-D-alanine carboxypeptidase (penicillin-binding protein 5/6)